MFSVWHESSFVLNNKLVAKDPSPFTAVKSTTLPKEPNPKSFRETNIRGSRHLLPCRLNLLYNSGWTQLFFFFGWEIQAKAAFARERMRVMTTWRQTEKLARPVLWLWLSDWKCNHYAANKPEHWYAINPSRALSLGTLALEDVCLRPA